MESGKKRNCRAIIEISILIVACLIAGSVSYVMLGVQEKEVIKDKDKIECFKVVVKYEYTTFTYKYDGNFTTGNLSKGDYSEEYRIGNYCIQNISRARKDWKDGLYKKYDIVSCEIYPGSRLDTYFPDQVFHRLIDVNIRVAPASAINLYDRSNGWNLRATIVGLGTITNFTEYTVFCFANIENNMNCTVQVSVKGYVRVNYTARLEVRVKA